MRKRTLGKGTTLCISIAERPSDFGATLFNALFEKMGMDWAYKPFKVGPDELPHAVVALRAFGIRGCGVSMPHKAKVMRHLDFVDPAAREIGAVNTIVNENGTLKGYNTDVLGFASAIREKYDLAGKSAIVHGTGGAARAAIAACKKLGARKIFVCGRNQLEAKRLCGKFGCKPVLRSMAAHVGAQLFFNATPIGMYPKVSSAPITAKEINAFEAVADAVNNPVETRLVRTARKMGKAAIPGYLMSIYQGLAQFELYTGKKPRAAGIERKMMLAMKNR